MIKLVKSLLLIVLFPVSISIAQETNDNSWSLEECIDYALNNNLDIKNSEYNVEDYRIQWTQSKAGMYPSANAGGGYTNLWGRSIDPTTNRFTNQRIQSLGLQLNANYTLYGGSQLRNSVKRSKMNLEGSTYDLETIRNDVMLNVTLAFLNVILNTELFENAKSQLEITKAQLEITRKQVKAGALPYSSELDLIAQVESNEVQVINTENDVRLSYLNLKQYLLLPADTPFEIVMPELNIEDLESIAITSNEVFATAEDIMPQIKSVDMAQQSAELLVKISRGALDPRLTVGANMYSNYSSAGDRERFLPDPDGSSTTFPDENGYWINPLDPDPSTNRIPVFKDVEVPNGEIVDSYPLGPQLQDNWSYSLSMNLVIPIFNGLQSKSGLQRARIMSKQAGIFAKQVRQNLRQTIERAYNDAIAASKSYNASDKQVVSLEESFRAAERSYNLGAMNIYDYQVASNNLFRARSDLLRAKYNYIFTAKVLDFYLGKPLTLD